MACSHPGSREGSACSPLPFLWGTNLRVGCMDLVGLYGLLVGLLGLGSVAWTEPRLLRTVTGQQSWRSERAELEVELLRTELLVAEKYGLARTHLDSLAPSIENSGMDPAAFFCFTLICDDLCQPILTSGFVVIGTAVSNSSQCSTPQRCPWPAGDFCVTVCFGTRGDEDLHRWAHRWTQQTLEQY